MKAINTIKEKVSFIRGGGFKNLFVLYIPITLLFLQYQVNWIYGEDDDNSIVRLVYSSVLMLFALAFVLKRAHKKVVWLLLLQGVVIGALVLSNPLHIASAALFLMYGYCIVNASNDSLNKIIKFLFFFNAIIMICQLLGLGAIFYDYQNYSYNTKDFISFFDGETTGNITAHQARMSGMFPSTICLSVFQFLVFEQLVASKAYGSKTTYCFVGFIFAVAGSTVSVMLFLLSTIFLFKRVRMVYFQLGFLLGLLVLFCFFRDIFDFNYSLETKLHRVDSRLISDEGNSLLTGNYLSFMVIVFSMLGMAVVQKISKRKRGLLNLLLFLLMVISPLIVHPLQSDIHYWLIVGVSLAHYIASRGKIKQRSGPVFLKPPMQELT